jgi:hypothetical protein
MSLNIAGLKISEIPHVFAATTLKITHQAEMYSPKLDPHPSQDQIVPIYHYFFGRHDERS